jgi:hypothetical protein
MHRRTLLMIAVAGALTLGCSRSSANLKSLTIDEVQAKITANDGKTFIYDNNDKERYDKGHVPGAKWVKFDNVTAADLPTDKNATLIFYCANEL